MSKLINLKTNKQRKKEMATEKRKKIVIDKKERER